MNYFDIKAISNSSLNYIDPVKGGNPRYFKKFLDGQLEERPSKSFEIGTLIHEELLEPGKLDIVPDAVPGPKTQDIIQALFVRLYGDLAPEDVPVVDLDTFNEDTLAAVIPDDFYPKYTLQTKINRILKDGSDYWKCICTSAGKMIVDPATYYTVQGCVESIKMHESANEFIIGNGFGRFDEGQQEVEITFDTEWQTYDGLTVDLPIKAKVDRILLNHTDKTINLVDLKTTSKPLGRFEEAFEQYSYYRQLAYYRYCLTQAFPEYKVTECFIVAVQTNKEYPCEVFKVDSSWINHGVSEMNSLLDRVAYHMAHGNWGNSMETQMGMIQSLILPDGHR